MPRGARFLDGIERLLELERAEERARFEALRRELSATERAVRGYALVDVEAVDEGMGLGGRVLVMLERADRRPIAARIDAGDVVELRPRRAETDEPARAVVARKRGARLTVAFDRPPPAFVLDGRLVVDLVPNDVTFARARGAIAEWRKRLDARDPSERRRAEVLLGDEHPRFGPPIAIQPSRPLNAEQRAAVERALAAEELFLVHGPPGTGKSTVLVEVAVQAVARGARVLATAASNAAVDNLLDLCIRAGLRAVRVGHPARVAERLEAHTLDALVEEQADRAIARELQDEAYELLGYARRQRTRGRSRERFANAREAKAEASRLFDEARALERRAVRAILDGAQVICATCTSLPGGELAGERFDLALLDEATQAIEPVALLGALRAPKVVLAGDHRQLPPTVLSREAAAGGLGVSLFERLLADHERAAGDVRVMLREQHRMNAGIMEFPSVEMYGGELRAHPSVAAHELGERLAPGHAVEAPPLLFVDTAGKGFEDALAEGSDSRRNDGEAELVVARLAELLDAGLAPSEVAVIAPYRAQVERVRERMAARGLPEAVEVDTVDAFQGREKEAVLVTLTRSNAEGDIGFLADLRRMNVAITRARRHLFVVGDSATLAAHPFYARFVEHAASAGGYRSAWEWPDPFTER